ncbi:MAG: recombinase family protein [Terriglobales bacterium]
MRAVLYARVSTTDKQDPEMQLAELREYASRPRLGAVRHLCGSDQR